MASWQARLMNVAVRIMIRRRHWGGELALARRARRVFGTPSILQSVVARGLSRQPVQRPVRGEWLCPKVPWPGVLLYIHGGGFVACSPATHRPITAALARLTQLRVFSLDYRLAPEHRYPAAVEDVVRAYEWLQSETEGSPIAVAGDSAGGNLVLGLALRLRDRGQSLPACLVAFSPWTDLAATGASARTNDGLDPMFHYENMNSFAGAYLNGVSPNAPEVSPVFADLGGLPPVLLHVGATETLLDDSRRVHERIRDAGGVSELKIHEGVAQCWHMLQPFVPEATASLCAAAAFITRNLQASLCRSNAS
jgi:acetyl esterase/lipase